MSPELENAAIGVAHYCTHAPLKLNLNPVQIRFMEVKHRFKAIQDHTFAVERHVIKYRHLRVFEHTFVCDVSGGAIGPNHPGQNDFLTGLGLHCSTIVCEFSVGNVTFPVLKYFDGTEAFVKFKESLGKIKVLCPLDLGDA